MFQLTHQSKIFLAVQAIDLRKGIDGIAVLCRQKLNIDPMSGAVFIFKNRLQTTLKILCYDGQGFWLCTKRLSSGKISVAAQKRHRFKPIDLSNPLYLALER